jgi:hypothetical protein
MKMFEDLKSWRVEETKVNHTIGHKKYHRMFELFKKFYKRKDKGGVSYKLHILLTK